MTILCYFTCRLQHHEVTLPPGFECDPCILQVERQAKEFSWIDSVFRSCADIIISDSPSIYIRHHTKLIITRQDESAFHI